MQLLAAVPFGASPANGRRSTFVIPRANDCSILYARLGDSRRMKIFAVTVIVIAVLFLWRRFTSPS